MFGSPAKNINYLKLGEGMKVADLGAGNGFYLKALSQKVGNSGKVYAVEVQKELVLKMEDDIKHFGLSNVSIIWGDIERHEGTKILSNSIDAVLLSNVLFQAEDKFGVVDEIKRILKNNGEVLVLEQNRDNKNYMKKGEVEKLFTKNNFIKSEDIPISSSQYGIIFKYE